MATTDIETRTMVPRRKRYTDSDPLVEETGPSPGASPDETIDLFAGDVLLNDEEILAGAYEQAGGYNPNATADTVVTLFEGAANTIRTRRGLIDQNIGGNVYVDMGPATPLDAATDNQRSPIADAPPAARIGGDLVPDNPLAGMSVTQVEDMISRLVAVRLAEQMVGHESVDLSANIMPREMVPQGSTFFAGGSKALVDKEATDAPKRYVAHFRDDKVPSREMYELDMNKIDAGLSIADSVIRGSTISFRRGHFFAINENQARQLRRASSMPEFDETDPNRVVGGAPTIYEVVEDEELLTCPISGCGEKFAKLDTLQRHLQATHSTKLEV